MMTPAVDDRRESRSEAFLSSQNVFSVSAEDYATLGIEKRVAETVIEASMKVHLQVTSHVDDHRFFYLSSHAIVHARNDPGRLSYWLEGDSLHDFDMIL